MKIENDSLEGVYNFLIYRINMMIEATRKLITFIELNSKYDPSILEHQIKYLKEMDKYLDRSENLKKFREERTIVYSIEEN